MKPCRVFEPKEPIHTIKDFSRELLKYKKREGLDLTIIEESMEPIIDIEGRHYVCHLGDANLNETENPFQRAFGMMSTVKDRKVVKINLTK